MAQPGLFHYEVAYSQLDPPDALNSRGTTATTVTCHGKLVAETKGQLEELFQRTPFEGRIVLDLSDVHYVDSAGLGALMRLKLSAVKHAGVSVKFVKITPRVMQLLSIANLTDWFSS